MSVPLAHLHALAHRTLDAHERRAGELRARLAPVLAAGVAGGALLSPEAVAALRGGTVISTGVFLLTLVGALFTVSTIGRFLSHRSNDETMRPERVHRLLTSQGALDDERSFHEAMTSVLSEACAVATGELDTLHRQFTAIMCGILVVLCGLALTAVVAW